MDKNSNNKNLNFNDYLFGEDSAKTNNTPEPIILTKSVPTLPKNLDNSYTQSVSTSLKTNFTVKKVDKVVAQEEIKMPVFPKIEEEEFIPPVLEKKNEDSLVIPMVSDSVNSTEIPNDLLLLSPKEEETDVVLREPEIENVHVPVAIEKGETIPNPTPSDISSNVKEEPERIEVETPVAIEKNNSTKPILLPFIQKVEHEIDKEEIISTPSDISSIAKEEPEKIRVETPVAVEKYDSVKPVFPPFIQKVEPVIPQVENPAITPVPKVEENIPEEVVNINTKDKLVKKKDLSKIILLPIFVIILGIVAFFLYVNWEKVSTFIKDAIDYTKSEEVTGIEKEDLSRNDINSAIETFLNGKYQVNDSGGFGYIYTKTLDGKSEESTGEISLGNGVSKTEDYSYFENGSLRFFDLGNSKRAVWDMNGNKYILFVNEKKYFAISSVSEPYYKNYAGQHILQDIVKSYKLNKNLFKKGGDNIWTWKWSLYSPVDYVTKMNFDTKIYVTNDKISKIEVYSPSGDSLLGAFTFTYESSSITEDMIIPKDFVRVPESTLLGK